jgi:hypothetical protein
VQGLSRAHQVKVVVRNDVEELQDLVEHVAVLGGDTNEALDTVGGLERLDHWSHLDRFGAGAEHREDSNRSVGR